MKKLVIGFTIVLAFIHSACGESIDTGPDFTPLIGTWLLELKYVKVATHGDEFGDREVVLSGENVGEAFWGMPYSLTFVDHNTMRLRHIDGSRDVLHFYEISKIGEISYFRKSAVYEEDQPVRELGLREVEPASDPVMVTMYSIRLLNLNTDSRLSFYQVSDTKDIMIEIPGGIIGRPDDSAMIAAADAVCRFFREDGEVVDFGDIFSIW